MGESAETLRGVGPALSTATYTHDYYEIFYRPANHPGDPLGTTQREYRSVINNLNRFAQFPWWCERFDNPSRGLPLSTLYREFEVWRRRCGEPEPGWQLRPDDAPWPAYTLGDYSDYIVVGAMQQLVEVGRASTTANKVRLHNNAVWRHAARELRKQGVCLPLPENENYPVDVGEPIALLPDELERVLHAARCRRGMIGATGTEIPAGVWWPAAIMFVLSLGVRITAAVGIPTSNLDLVRGEVRVPASVQKNHHEQLLDLFPSVVAMLRDLRLAERKVPTVLGDWQYSVNTLRRHYKQILVAADIGYSRIEDVPSSLLFHCLRRTLASMLIAEHGIHVACDRLDHSSISVTKRYHDRRYGGSPRIRDLLSDPMGDSEPPELRIVHAS